MPGAYSVNSYANLFGPWPGARRPPADIGDLSRDVPAEPEVAFALSIAPYRNCVDWRATANAKLDYSSPDKEVDLVLQKPNEHQSKFGFFYAIVQDLVTYGVSYIWTERSRATGELAAMYTFNPDELKIEKAGSEIQYRPKRFAVDAVLTDKDLIKIEQRPGSNVYISDGLEAAWPLLLNFNMALKRINAIWRNGATASHYIKLKDAASEDAMRNLKKYLESTSSWASPDYGKPLVLTNDATLERVELTGVDAWPPFLKEIVAQIAASQKVPFYVASGQVETKYDNFAQTVEMSHADTILPMAKQISIELAKGLGKDVNVNTNELLLGSPAQRVKLLMDTGFLSTNQRREQAKRWGIFDPDLLERIEQPAMDMVTGVQPVVTELAAQRDAARLLTRKEGLIDQGDVEEVLDLVPDEQKEDERD